MSLFKELKRRNVIRVAAAYLIIGWLLAQVSATLESALHMPEWFDTMVVTVMLIGFPIALIISWVYELTPDGIKKEKDIQPDESIVQETSKKLNYITVVAALAVAGMFAWQQMNPPQQDSRDIVDGENDTEVVDKIPENKNNSVIPVKTGIQSHDATQVNDKSIAVLPFVDLSPAKDQEYFTDGLTENLLHALAQIREIKVAGRTSSFAFKNHNVDLREIGKTLNVQKLLEGSVQKSGKRIRITAQLINADDGIHIWSKKYDRDLVDIFAVQDEITAAVVMALRQSILGKDELNGGYNGNFDAYNAYLLGLNYLKKRNIESFELAIKEFKKALDIDPSMALAWAGLSQAYSDKTGFGTYFASGYEQARVAALKAVELDPNLPEAYLALADIQKSYDWDWDGAEDSLNRAYSLRPNDAEIMSKLAMLKWDRGKHTEALKDTELALALDPLNESIQGQRTRMLYYFNRYQEILPFAQEQAKKYPERGALHNMLGLTYYQLGDYKQALEVIEHEKFTFLRLELEAILYHKLGKKSLAKQKLKELTDNFKDDVSWQVASVYAAWGDADQAFAALNRGFEARDPGLVFIQESKWFDPYHEDPRYAAFLKKMGFK